MKKRKALSLLLSMTLLFSLALPATTAHAENNSNKGMEISKTATANKDGSYTITLEAYATGSKVVSEITKDIPTDIILVLDQSGSMADDIGTVSFEQYEDESDRWGNTTAYHTRNQDYYEYRHNGGSGNLWHKLAEGSYVSVSVIKQEQIEYTQLGNLKNYEISWDLLTTNCYYYYANNLYEKIGDVYKKVELIRSGNMLDGYTYTYTFADGTTVTSSDNDRRPNLGSHAPLYTGAIDDTQTVYTYTYTDSDGNVQTIGTSTGAETVFSPTLYKRVTNTNGGGSRLAAIKTAALNFTNAVSAKAAGADGDIATTADNINHRIAVVGFASQSGYGNNTELLSIGGRNSGNVGVAYDNISDQNLKDVVQNMDTSSGQNMVASAIDALTANGATQIDLGMDMAERILDTNPVSSGEKRNRVVIVFTDGAPTSFDGFNKSVAHDAITISNRIKASGATVYSIGVFSGADANSAGVEPNGNLNQNSSQLTSACNWFMQGASSNNGTPQSPSYYLSAADADSLNNIFQQISDQIETGGSSSTLTEEAIVKDIISPQFTLPAGATTADITLETYRCTGKNGADYTWSKNADAMGAKASINGDQVNVTGFNFSENYVGTVTENGNTSYRGNKLVISFKIQPKAGFLGGNDVFTNTSAGIYPDDSAKTPILTFDRPAVNVPIQDVKVTAEDKNVYLKGEVTADQLKDGAEISVGDVKLDLNKENYGLESWQNEYVDINIELIDANGNVISDKLKNLTEDTTYTVEVTITPKTEGAFAKGSAATEKTGVNDPEAKICVFKPELTFKDTNAYYGEEISANNDYSGNRVGNEKWMHGDTCSTDAGVTMLGIKPMPEIRYTPDESKIANGKYTKQDVPVSVVVSIDGEDVSSYTSFVHQDCNPACDWKEPTTPGMPAFLIHARTCTLNITKQGGADDESYVFDVYKDGEKYSEVTVWGNGTETLVELPIGTYTIRENTGWSWRYSGNNGGSAELTAKNPTGSIVCLNTKNNNQWLNGFSEVVRNIFGTNH